MAAGRQAIYLTPLYPRGPRKQPTCRRTLMLLLGQFPHRFAALPGLNGRVMHGGFPGHYVKLLTAYLRDVFYLKSARYR